VKRAAAGVESLSAAVVRQDERVNSVVQVVEPRMPDTAPAE